jgi:hypothetical protein
MGLGQGNGSYRARGRGRRRKWKYSELKMFLQLIIFLSLINYLGAPCWAISFICMCQGFHSEYIFSLSHIALSARSE